MYIAAQFPRRVLRQVRASASEHGVTLRLFRHDRAMSTTPRWRVGTATQRTLTDCSSSPCRGSNGDLKCAELLGLQIYCGERARISECSEPDPEDLVLNDPESALRIPPRRYSMINFRTSQGDTVAIELERLDALRASLRGSVARNHTNM